MAGGSGTSRQGGAASGRGLVIGRVLWLAVAVPVVALFVAGVPPRLAQLARTCVGPACAPGQLTPADVPALPALHLTLAGYATFLVGIDSVSALIWFVLGLMIWWRLPRDRMALFTAFTLVLFGVARFPDVPAALGAANPAWALPVGVARFAGSACLSLFVYLFPGGTFAPRWMRWAALLWLVPQIPEFLFPQLPVSPTTFPLPLLLLAFLAFVASVGVSQLYRYWWVSTPAQREQAKWVVFGTAAALIIYAIVAFALPVFLPPSDQTGPLPRILLGVGAVAGMLCIPVSISVAILRYRLFDIDFIINRALVYGLVSAVLAAVYFGAVAALQAAVRALTGAENAVAIVASTLLIAALFQPLRGRVQTTIDRRFYRARYDASRALANFSATLREEVDLPRLREHLVETVASTIRPAHVTLWLRTPAPAGVAGTETADGTRSSGEMAPGQR